MPDVVTVILELPKCVTCGSDLPRGRKRFCHGCKPKKRYKPEPEVREKLPYTLADRVAMARAYGLSYGQYMAHIENGWNLPEMIRPVEWPEGSEHKEE